MLRLIGGTVAATSLPIGAATAQSGRESSAMLTRAIPSSGEMLPVIGLGTWQVFDVGSSATEGRPLERVLATLAKYSGKVVDTSPMRLCAEAVTGELAAESRLQEKLFFATKLPATRREWGARQ